MFKLNLTKLRDYVEVIASTILMLISLFCLIKASNVVCMLSECNNPSKTTISTIYPRSVATGCFLSRIVTLYKKAHAFKMYERKIEEYEIHHPTSRGKNAARRQFVTVTVLVCAISMIPINVYRLVLLNTDFPGNIITVYFGLLYAQNMSQCVSELYFCAYCFGLFQRFRTINEEMSALKSEAILANSYPLILKTDEADHDHVGLASKIDHDLVIEVHPLVEMIERLKLRHKCISNAVRRLNDLYGFLLGLSLSVLFLMSLTDIYEILSSTHISAKHAMFYYIWLFQYGFRFCMIVTTTHVTTKEVKTKKKNYFDHRYYVHISV